MNKINFLKKNIFSNTCIFNSTQFLKNQKFFMSFQFSNLNPLKLFRSPSVNDHKTRLEELKTKIYSQNKKELKSFYKNSDNDNEESVEYTKDIFIQKSFDRFIKYMGNKEQFTWQNNLELIKVKIFFYYFKLASTNNPNVIWSRYVYYDASYLQQSIDELSKFFFKKIKQNLFLVYPTRNYQNLLLLEWS